MDDEVKRLKRFIYVSWGLLLAVVVGFTIWASVEIKNFNSQITQIALSSQKEPVVIKGLNGTDGLQGAQGVPGVGVNGSNGSNGTDGQNITPDQIASAVSSYLAANPPANGAQGEAGPVGKSLEVQVDPATCQLESKYDTDDYWKVIAQLTLPCGVAL